jgi:peptide/nickel transport system permease protein
VTVFLIRRVMGMVLVLFLVSFLVFFIFILVPGGDPATRIAGRNATSQNIANIRHDWGFDRPFYVQYVAMMRKAFTGKLISYTNQTNVVQQIKQGIPVTFSLAIGAGIIWLFFGIAVGVVSAVKAGKATDKVVTVFALIGISLPVFWLGLIVRYYVAEGGFTTFFPDGGYVPLTTDPVEWFSHLILPWTVLAVGLIGFYGRVLRSNVLDTVNEDYVRTARAKGIAPRKVMVKHVLRNSLIPIVTLFGLDFAATLGGGAILTEVVFDLPGVGWYAAQNIGSLDLPPILGVTLFGAFFIVVFSAIVDIAYVYLDPRIRPS